MLLCYCLCIVLVRHTYIVELLQKIFLLEETIQQNIQINGLVTFALQDSFCNPLLLL